MLVGRLLWWHVSVAGIDMTKKKAEHTFPLVIGLLNWAGDIIRSFIFF
jgi:hypothetical protein